MTAAQQVTLRSALAALGDTPEAVADTLRRRGVYGVRHDAARHPVVRYLMGLTQAAGLAEPLSLARVGSLRILCQPRLAGTVVLGVAAARFSWGFDSGQYPELEEAEEDAR